MLIEFSVTNFRSFRDKQTLSMVAAPRLRKRDNVFKPEVVGEKFPDLLKVAVIYGPNASGKSNLLKALDVLPQLSMREPKTREEPLPIAPFRFDATLADQPSKFELHFIQGGTRYQFIVSATAERIVSEGLNTFAHGREVFLYERIHRVDGETYRFGQQLIDELGQSVLDTWIKLTPARLLFLAQAVANSNEAPNSLKPPFEWLCNANLSLTDGMGACRLVAQRMIARRPANGDSVAKFLEQFDVPISKVSTEIVAPLQSGPGPGLGLGLGLASAKDASLPSASSTEVRTTLTHKTALGKSDLSYDDESEGTKNLIGFWLPWWMKDISGRLLVVDELDNSLHPKIVSALVENHIQSGTPTQLIFSTHDTHLMDTKILRRDQFWITERDANGATQLRSIHDFEGRESEDIEKRYYEGRYRGLPLVKRAS
jgi:energy-coupling factor transporter ATP-binding protein EcfA2